MNNKTHLHFVKSQSQNKISRIDFTTLRHEEIRAINSFCETDKQKEWALSDCFYDWKAFAKMKKDDVLILKIHKGGTHLFPIEKLDIYKEIYPNCPYFKITCYEDRAGKEDFEGYDYTIEPYEV